MNSEQHSDIPDKTYSEIEAEDTDLDLASPDEVNEEAEAFLRMGEIVFTSSMLSEMFRDDIITLREYFTLTDYLEDQYDELPISVF